MLKIIHAADFHLDSPFSALTPEQSALRRQELRRLPSRLAELVRVRQADLVLLSGDLFDGSRVFPETVDALQAALGGMSVPVFIAPGNHDPYHSRSPYAAPWPSNVRIFTGPEPESAELPWLGCTVHGCAFTSAHREDDPLSSFAAPDDGSVHLLCLHGEVGRGGTYAPISPDSLAASRARYAALGHIHACSGLQKAGNTFWAYPGCPEGRGFDECGDKGVFLITIDGDDLSAEFIPLSLRRYRIETADVSAGDEALSFSPTPDLVRLLLRGERDRAPDLSALHARWKDSFFHLELRDETTLSRDLWDRAEEDSLTGLFLRRMGQRMAGASEEEQRQLLLAVRFGLAALEGGEDIRP